MPCIDYYDDHPGAYFRDVTEPALKKQIAFAESALCAALDALERANSFGSHPLKSVYEWINFEDAGITKKELVAWRKKHQELDKKHREQELAAARESAMAKLTDLEKKALKLK